MLTAEENEKMTRIGPGTPMGELFRRYWHPIAATSQLPVRSTKPVKLLGESLVLYRDRRGQVGLVGERCPHRRAGMVFGIPEEEGLRCAYHGWLFNAEGRCLEQPYEQTEAPESTYREQTPIVAYPVEERAGMIFAYLGPKPAPLFPNYDLFVWDNVMRDVGHGIVPCNWLQVMENSLDPIHVEWLHTYFSNFVLEKLGRPDLKRSLPNMGRTQWRHTRVGFDVFEHGIIKRRLLEGMTEDDDGWATGHPVIFPNILRTGKSFQIRVPRDDETTEYWWYNTHAGRGVEVRPQDGIPVYEVPIPGLDERGEPQWSVLDNNSGQDIAMWYTQGAVADREQEHLGASDKGVAIYRKLLEANMLKALRGEDPMNVFRDPAKNVLIEFQTEQILFNRGDPNQVARNGQSHKYSPIAREATARLQGEQALLDPVH
ncbi:MAG TPA: Rieske 2Fe-2S domain-containing protein [Rhodothermia bacterium]|nr:Rieske 2Fe-2S domain-containing protein [Rhodothermia bacterium]